MYSLTTSRTHDMNSSDNMSPFNNDVFIFGMIFARTIFINNT